MRKKMNEHESLEQYNRGVVRIYIENATLETLLELQREIKRQLINREINHVDNRNTQSSAK